MIRIWGRETGLCVKKVLWCCRELDLQFERIDAGKQYGQTNTKEYLAMNPNGTVPTLIDGDYVLWESNAILRYLARQYGHEDIYPMSPREHGDVNRWIDWSSGNLWTDTVWLVNGLMRTPPEKRNLDAISATSKNLAKSWAIADERLSRDPYIAGPSFTIADITMGVLAQLWMGFELTDRPELLGFKGWYDRISARPGFQRYATIPLEPN